MADGQSYFLLMLGLSVLAYFGFSTPPIINTPVTYLGLLFVIAGLFLCCWTRSVLIKNHTTLSPFEIPGALVTSGPFRFSRNPVYLGMAAILLGTAILMGTGISFIFPLLFIVIMEVRFIPLEEKTLERVFGEEFIHYKRTVRKWI
ncbi:methyltransferase family protein [Methanospirillum lacunae]|uniref:Isoprenylcysteine carboxylmethyltransferase family protein n=1 Tax=Methanospirillum lacunae TaxID=668570 RepID=A0A2V2N6V1_9EURY|nr:isoprenylcysteine carboxylmethyltransferase family protein [Methanospirillum lacunae]PWR74350.1 hypothetical protein DK846_04160 [Methanospirillum lacunae]